MESEERFATPFDAPLMVTVRELEGALAESSGIETARTAVQRAMESSRIPLSQESLTTAQAEAVCSVLMKSGGLVSIVAESFLDDLEKRLLKTVEQTLWRSEKMLATLINTIPTAIYMKDIRGRVILVNEAFERLVGLPAGEIIGGHDHNILPEAAAGENARIDRWVVNTGRPRRHEFGFEVEGRQRMIEGVKTPVRNSDGEIVSILGVLDDVTDRKLMQDELLKAVRLESVGQLAGGIAHDFNNLLTVIIGSASLAARKTEAGEDPGPSLAALQEAAGKAKSLTQRLLTFSTGGAPVKSVVDFREVLLEAVELALAGSRIRSVFRFDENLPRVQCDRGQMIQAVHSMVTNSRQAMPAGGTITVSAECVKVYDSRSKDPGEDGERLPVRSGEYLRFCVQDHGIGIPKGIRNRIFDPYFTTRDKSTGLGLPLAYNVLRRHQGYLKFVPPRAGGAAFYGYLPSAGKLPPPEPADAGHPSNLRILVMDDEPMVLEVVREMLSALGHIPFTASDGESAVEMYERAAEEGEPFDLLILDLTVPGGMGGEETLKQLRSRYPEVRAFVSSGYSNNPIMAHYDRHGFAGVIAKPYHLTQLRDTILNYLKA